MRTLSKVFLVVLLIAWSGPVAVGQDKITPLNVYYGPIPEGDRTFFVAPDGSNGNAGTEEEPWATLDYAVGQVQRGDVIVMRGGEYHHSETIRIQTPSGFIDELITVVAYPGEVPILDFSSQPKVRDLHGLRINANFWHIIGITVRYASHNGIRMDGSYNILEQVTAYGHHDTGIHMAGGASHNLLKNCDSFHNFNYDVNRTPRIGNNADGFGAKFNIGPGNRYYGCRAWENSDDGFDFWEATSTIVIENSWAFGNGDAAVFGNPDNFEGNGNGFKLGGNHVRGDHVVRRSLAFDNFGSNGNAKGFDFNNNPGAMTLVQNTAYNNGRNYWFPVDPPSHGQSVFINNLSAVTSVHAVTPPSAVVAGNSWQQEIMVTEDMFLSVDTAPAKGPRQMDGSLPDIDLLRPAAGTFIVDGGVAIGEPFYGSKPDMGAFDFVEGELVDPWVQRGSGSLIADLTVYDLDNAEHWAVVGSIGPGTELYGDDGHTLVTISGQLEVDEWIRTAAGTSPKNYLFTTAEFALGEARSILIAHSDEISPKPEWLSAYDATDFSITIRESEGTVHELTIYEKDVAMGENVALGRNSMDGNPDVPMYVAMVGRIVPVFAEDTGDLPAEFVLDQNYPNPFNAATTITYSVPHQSHVSIRVFDVMGREVAELANREHEAGSHSVVWNADAFASGLYYYRMTAGDFSTVKSLMLVK